MKKLMLLSVLVLFLFVAGVSACEDVFVSGTVFSGPNSDTAVVGNADVIVSCQGQTLNTKNVLSGSDGSFESVFSYPECGVGDDVFACVGNKCSSHLLITSEDDCLASPLFIMGVDVFNVPEFGVIAGGIAITGGLLGFLLIRKK